MLRHTLVVWYAALAYTAPAADPQVLFVDRFEGKLADGWVWLKQDDKAWRFRDGGLEFRVLAGQVNVLARTVPDSADGPFAVEVTLTSEPQPTRQYEQVGFFWYANGKPGPKFVKELIDGKPYVFPGKKEMAEATVQLRLVIEGKKFTGQYRPAAKGDYLTASSGDVPPAEKGKLQIAIACHNGPADAEHWVRCNDFRIVKLPRR